MRYPVDVSNRLGCTSLLKPAAPIAADAAAVASCMTGICGRSMGDGIGDGTGICRGKVRESIWDAEAIARIYLAESAVSAKAVIVVAIIVPVVFAVLVVGVAAVAVAVTGCSYRIHDFTIHENFHKIMKTPIYDLQPLHT